MPGGLVVLLIVAASTLLGWLIMRQFVRAPVSSESADLGILFAGLALGLSATGWIALLLAEVGLFSVGLLGAIWVALLLGFGVFDWRRRNSSGRQDASGRGLIERAEECGASSPSFKLISLPSWLELPLLGLWLIAATWLYFRPHEFIIGGADAGVYVNLGAEIAQNGHILIQDELLAQLDPTLYPAFLRPILNPEAPYYILPGFYVTGEPPGEITPQFYPLHPVWQAIAYSLGGVPAELLMTGMWALLGSIAIYLTVRQIAGWEVAGLALAGVSLNALQVWFARYPTTELLSQYLLWVGLWSLGAWLSEKRPRRLWAAVAGVALGQLFLVRIDTFVIAPVLLLLGLWLWARGRWQSIYWWFFLPLALGAVHSLVHAATQSRPYAYDLLGFTVTLFTTYWLVPAFLLAGGLGTIFVVARFRKQWAKLGALRQILRWVGMSMVILLAAYAWFVRPYATIATAWADPYSTLTIPSLNHENLRRLGWYLSPLGIWLGVIGVCLLIWKADRKTSVIIGSGLSYSLFYLWRISANPHQIYAMRRYVPAVMPFFIIAAAYGLGFLASRRRHRSTGVAILLATLWLGGLGWLARGFVSQVDYRGVFDQIDQINALLAPDSVLLFNDQSPIGQDALWGTPMRFLFGHHVFTLRDPVRLSPSQLDATIGRWQTEGHDVYWIEVPDGQEQLLPKNEMTLVRAYEFSTTLMEMSYERRPRALVPFLLAGSIFRLERQPISRSAP